MPSLSEYRNVYDTALNLLEQKGFQVWFDEKLDMFCAERSGWDFTAENPISLLGLVAIFEAAKPTEYSEYWWRDQESAPRQPLAGTPRAYDPIARRKS